MKDIGRKRWLVQHAGDVERIRKALENAGYKADSQDIVEAWVQFSATGGWFDPAHMKDEEIVRWLYPNYLHDLNFQPLFKDP